MMFLPGKCSRIGVMRGRMRKAAQKFGDDGEGRREKGNW